jgi:S-adenosylmethionine:tRNA ribosyltransferase-isomerase
MKLSDFHYDLPEELIAKHPPKVRGSSKLLVLDRKTGDIKDTKYADLVDFLSPGDVLVLNDTKVMKSRIFVKLRAFPQALTAKGAKRELVILEKHSTDTDWHQHKVLYRGKLKAGDVLQLSQEDNEKLNAVLRHEAGVDRPGWFGLYDGDKIFRTIVVEEILGDGIAIVSSKEDLLEMSNTIGVPPLPPYLKRDATPADIRRYQTVFADKLGSAAAPTASLNMTDALLAKLKAKGVKIAYLTLHVGLGTFLPIRVDDVKKHKMHAEFYEIPPKTLKIIEEARTNNHRIIALGTTVARTLEHASSTAEARLLDGAISLAKRPRVRPGEKPCLGGAVSNSLSSNITGKLESLQPLSGEADIFIYPGHKFKIIDALLTNFHAPNSTVLMLTAALAGPENLKNAYDHAKKSGYKFLSYGDSMLIL